MNGLGQPLDCGDNPCTWFDSIYARDACVAYTCCTDPAGIACTAYTKGVIGATGQAAGEAFSRFFSGLGTGLTENPGGTTFGIGTAILTIGLLGIGAWVVMTVAEKF